MTLTFQKKLAAWENFFTLTKLVKLTEHDYRKILGHLNTNIPYSIFYRNILMAMERIHN
jgi:hypothetical protein